MSGVISIRTTKEERAQIKKWCKERDISTMSELIRAQLGFQPGLEKNGTRELEVGEIDGFENLVAAHYRTEDRIDDLRRLVNKMARHMGVILEEPKGALPDRMVPSLPASNRERGDYGPPKPAPEIPVTAGFSRG